MQSQIILFLFQDRTNAEPDETAAEVLRVNATAVEVEAETVRGEGRMGRTRPIVTVWASEVKIII